MIVRIEHRHQRFIVIVSDGRQVDRFEFGHPEAAVAWVRTLRR